jgi:pSer/pThr/pTyr-binding forkhead associated (FHA) protein
MTRKPAETFDEALPALIVTYGNTTRKHRPLDRDVLVIGQNRTCDLGLSSPEVAPVHCLVIHSQDGWHIRDCGSRCGTRLNGKVIHEAPLCDGDALQIGPFSFQVHLPPPAAVPVIAAAPLAPNPRVQRSRRNLAQLALRLRRRLQASCAASAESAQAERGLAHRQAALDQQAEQLRQQLREHAECAARLEQAKRDLVTDRTRLEADRTAFQTKLEQAEKELARARMSGRPEGTSLDARRQELDRFARHLQQARRDLQEEKQRFADAKEALARDRAALEAEQANQQLSVRQAENRLRDQRDALTRMIDEVRRLHQLAIPGATGSPVMEAES